MTMNDFLVVGSGTVILLILFLAFGAIRDAGTVNLWAVLRRYVAVRVVSDYQDDARVMSRTEAQTAQTNQTDGQDGRVSEADRWLDRLEVDRTKTALIEVLVYSGWTVEQIRRLIKGENGALGAEIETARKRLGIEPPAPHITPYAGRATNARFEQTDPDYPYRPIEA